jgi:hypothetical protein
MNVCGNCDQFHMVRHARIPSDAQENGSVIPARNSSTYQVQFFAVSGVDGAIIDGLPGYLCPPEACSAKSRVKGSLDSKRPDTVRCQGSAA